MDGKKLLNTPEELAAFYKKVGEDKGKREVPTYEATVLPKIPTKLAEIPGVAGSKVVVIRVKKNGKNQVAVIIFVNPTTGKICGFRD